MTSLHLVAKVFGDHFETCSVDANEGGARERKRAFIVKIKQNKDNSIRIGIVNDLLPSILSDLISLLLTFFMPSTTIFRFLFGTNDLHSDPGMPICMCCPRYGVDHDDGGPFCQMPNRMGLELKMNCRLAECFALASYHAFVLLLFAFLYFTGARCFIHKIFLLVHNTGTDPNTCMEYISFSRNGQTCTLKASNRSQTKNNNITIVPTYCNLI